MLASLSAIQCKLLALQQQQQLHDAACAEANGISDDLQQWDDERSTAEQLHETSGCLAQLVLLLAEVMGPQSAAAAAEAGSAASSATDLPAAATETIHGLEQPQGAAVAGDAAAAAAALWGADAASTQQALSLMCTLLETFVRSAAAAELSGYTVPLGSCGHAFEAVFALLKVVSPLPGFEPPERPSLESFLYRAVASTVTQQQQSLHFFGLLCCLLKLSHLQPQANAHGVRTAVAAAAHGMLSKAADTAARPPPAAAAATAAPPPLAAPTPPAAAATAEPAGPGCDSNAALVLPWVVLLGRCCLDWAEQLSPEVRRVLTAAAEARAIATVVGPTYELSRDGAVHWLRAPLRRLLLSLGNSLFLHDSKPSWTTTSSSGSSSDPSSSSGSGSSSHSSSSGSGSSGRACFGWLESAVVCDQLAGMGMSVAAVQQQVHAAAGACSSRSTAASALCAVA
jgi:uncharacterized membrane protein YgcG